MWKIFLALLLCSSCSVYDYVFESHYTGGEEVTTGDNSDFNLGDESTGSLRLLVSPDKLVVATGGAVEVKVLVYEGDVLLFNTPPKRTISVEWILEDTTVASIDQEGILTGLHEGDTTITVKVKVEEVSSTNPSLDTISPKEGSHKDTTKDKVKVTESERVISLKVLFSDIKAINVSPTSLSLDKDGKRTFEAHAVDDSGNPTEIDCTVQWSYNPDYVSYVADNKNSITLKGIRKGYTLLYPTCDGVTGNPAIIEVKNPTPIPRDGNPDEGSSNDLTVAADGLHLSYYDATNGQLKYAFFESIWVTQVLPSRELSGFINAITMHHDSPIICGLEGVDITCWSFGSSGNWLKSTVSQGASSSPNSYAGGLDLTSSGSTLYLTWHEVSSNTLKFASSQNGHSWRVTTIDNGGEQVSLAIGDEGKPRVIYTAQYSLRYGSYDGNNWVIEDLIDTDGRERFLSLAIGQNEQVPQAVFVDENYQIIHAIREDEGGIWSQSVVGTSLGTAKLVLDNHDLPRISYQGYDDSLLHYARRLSKTRIGLKTRWIDDVPDSNFGSGAASSLAIDKDGRTHIAYYDSVGKLVKYYVEPHYFHYTKELEGSNKAVTKGGDDIVDTGVKISIDYGVVIPACCGADETTDVVPDESHDVLPNVASDETTDVVSDESPNVVPDVVSGENPDIVLDESPDAIPDEKQPVIPMEQYTAFLNPWVLIPESEFLNGSDVHVTLASYRIQKYEVSEDNYRACVTAGVCSAAGTGGECTYLSSGKEHHPINCLNFYQMQTYCQWIGGDLPTGNQWEFAARGTDGRLYPWGNDTPTCIHANYLGCTGGTLPVDSLPAGISPFGLYGMIGNVWDWTLDYYNFTSSVVIRGGSWGNHINSAVSTNGYSDPARVNANDGFRCVSYLD